MEPENNPQTPLEVEDKLKEAFTKVVQKYDLHKEENAKEIANYLTKYRKDNLKVEDFAKKFKMTQNEAKIVLAFIAKGVILK